MRRRRREHAHRRERRGLDRRRAARDEIRQQTRRAERRRDAESLVSGRDPQSPRRLPRADERQTAITFLRSGTLAQRAEDLQWVLLNSLEFLFD